MKHLAFDCRLWQANWHGSYKEKTTVSTLSVKPRISIKCLAYYTIFYYKYMKKKVLDRRYSQVSMFFPWKQWAVGIDKNEVWLSRNLDTIMFYQLRSKLALFNMRQ